jgi:hypothetical protein
MYHSMKAQLWGVMILNWKEEEKEKKQKENKKG